MSTDKPTYAQLERRLVEAEKVIQALQDRQANPAVSKQEMSVSRLKEAEKALRENEEKYRSVIENANIGIIVIQEGKQVFYNSKIHEMLGYTGQEYGRVDFMSLVHPQDRSLAFDRIRQRLDGIRMDPDSVEMRLLSKSGKTIWIEANSTVIQWEGRPALQSFVTDITEQKKAAAALQEREAFLNTLLDAIAIPVFYKDREGRYLGFNRAFEQFFGAAKKEWIGQSVFDVSPPELAEVCHTRDKELLERGGIQQYECQVKNAQGLLRDVIFDKAVYTDHQGTVDGLIGAILDITDMKRAQEKIESLSKFPSENPSPVLRVRRDGTILYSNDAALTLLAIWKTEVGGLIPAKWQYLIDEAFESGKTGRKEEEIDGRIFSFVIAPIAEGDYANLYGRDVTQHKQAENELQKSEERFRRFAMASGYGFAMGELTGQLVFANTATLQILEEESEDAFTCKTFYQYYIPEDAQRLRQEILPIVLEKGQWVGEIPLLSAKGNMIATEQNIFLIRDDQGTPQMIGNIITDITERTQKENELRRLNADLVLASRRAGMAEVATDVLHNVGNVLNSVNVSARFIADKVLNSKASNLKKVIDILAEHTGDLGTFLTGDERGKHIPIYLTEAARFILDEQNMIAERLQSLTKNIEHLKQIIKAQQNYARTGGIEVFASIGEVIEDAVEIHHAALKRYGIDVKFELTELPRLQMDKQRILQILVNLITNAKQALAESAKPEKVLTIRSSRHGKDNVRIEVADNGVGISPESMTRMFTYGFTTKKSGHGFGLHSSAVAAREMGGSLSVHSDGPGHGATFILELPQTKSGAITDGCIEP